MCGIAGIVYEYNSSKLQHITAMIDVIQPRGPDDYGIWLEQVSGVALGHRRLSILDLSQAGHQPMISSSDRFVITYNGEVYNYLEIQKELINLGVTFQGHADTEVILAAFEKWGIFKSLKRFNGMFAFAVWDRDDKKLYLSRDRFGEKPLYYGWVNGVLIFGSELKSLRQYSSWSPEIDCNVLGLFLRYGYIPAPHSIYKNIFKVKPGTFVEISANNREQCYVYWDAVNETQILSNGQLTSYNESVVINELHGHLSKSVRQKCISDVPLGAFLSGGIDSSLIVALMQENSKTPIKSFTIGFHEKNFNNEAPHAKKIAQYLRTDHTEFYVTEKDAREVIPKMPFLYDEPFADSSQIPTYLVSSLARSVVKVCLSGDGGDELFGGYNRYIWLNNLYKISGWIPYWMLKPFSFIKDEQWNVFGGLVSRLLPRKARIAFLGQKINKVLRSLKYSKNLQDFYVNISSVVNNPNDFLLNAEKMIMKVPPSNLSWYSNNDFIHWMMLADTVGYLQGDVLTKVDRASMGVSLETRAPYLDENVFKFVWQLPLRYKIRNGQGKYILRQLLYKYVPQDLMDKPKVGFGVPIGQWIKGDLREWAEDLLNTEMLKRDNIFAPNLVRAYWKQHLSEKHDWTHLLWNFLMFQAWFRENK